MKLFELFSEYEPFVIESGGTGRVIPGVNTTADVGPNEVTRQAKKFKFKVSKDGVPPTLKTNGKTTAGK